MNPEDVPPGPVLLDTDVYSWLRTRRSRHEEFASLLDGHGLVLSFVTVAEARAGAAMAGWGEQKRTDLDRHLGGFPILTPTNLVTNHWAAIYATLRDQLKGGGVNDMWVSACAMAQDPPMAVATGNLTDFRRIADAFGLTLIHPDL